MFQKSVPDQNTLSRTTDVLKRALYQSERRPISPSAAAVVATSAASTGPKTMTVATCKPTVNDCAAPAWSPRNERRTETGLTSAMTIAKPNSARTNASERPTATGAMTNRHRASVARASK
jgi:hypothetical protein